MTEKVIPSASEQPDGVGEAIAGLRFRLFGRLRLRLALARREEQVGFEAVLFRVQVEITAARDVERFVLAALDDAAGLYDQNLVDAADGGKQGRDDECGSAYH